MKHLIFTVAAFLSLVPLARAANPVASNPVASNPAYFISQPDMALDIVVPKYTMEINRVAEGPQAAAMLKRAEAVYPQRATIMAAIPDADFKTKLLRAAKEPLWWSSDFDGVRIPYAVTAGAVIYYQKLIQAFMRNDFSGSAGIKMITANLKYTANIKLHDKWTYEKQDFKNVYVADITLGWSQYCGMLCAMGFEKKRLVVLGRDGSIRAVFGDGATGVMVS